MRSLPEPGPRSWISDHQNLGAGSPTTRELVESEGLQGLPNNLEEGGLLEDQEVLFEGA